MQVGFFFTINKLNLPYLKDTFMLIEFNKIYYATYMPKFYLKLSLFDRNPLIVKLEDIHSANGPMILGVNMHFIPVPLRMKFMDFIISISNSIPEKGRFRIFYLMLKRMPALAFTLLAIRKYYVARLSNVIPIEIEDWPQLHILWASKYRARFYRRSISNPSHLHGTTKKDVFY